GLRRALSRLGFGAALLRSLLGCGRLGRGGLRLGRGLATLRSRLVTSGRGRRGLGIQRRRAALTRDAGQRRDELAERALIDARARHGAPDLEEDVLEGRLLAGQIRLAERLLHRRELGVEARAPPLITATRPPPTAGTTRTATPTAIEAEATAGATCALARPLPTTPATGRTTLLFVCQGKLLIRMRSAGWASPRGPSRRCRPDTFRRPRFPPRNAGAWCSTRDRCRRRRGYRPRGRAGAARTSRSRHPRGRRSRCASPPGCRGI